MGPLGNLDHERFCQAAHARIWAGEKRVPALAAAYVDTVYSGNTADREAVIRACAPNARRLANNNKMVKARLAELADYSAKLSVCDSEWAMLRAKEIVEFNVDDFLSPADERGQRFYDIGRVPREKLGVIAELVIDQWDKEVEDGPPIRGVRAKIKPPDRLAALSFMARIRGWEAPKKTAFTDPKGDGPGELVVYSSLDKARAVAAILAKAKAEAKAA